MNGAFSGRIPRRTGGIRVDISERLGIAESAAHLNLFKWLHEAGIEDQALKLGDMAPEFLLPDSRGRLVSSRDLRSDGGLVIKFFCGNWCRVCMNDLNILQKGVHRLQALNAKLVAITPDTREVPRNVEREYELDFPILSDVDHGVGLSFGITFVLPEETRAYLLNRRVDLPTRHGSALWMLPMPATYIISRQWVIRDVDIGLRLAAGAELERILCTLRGMG
jgi:peroxiredoxin